MMKKLILLFPLCGMFFFSCTKDTTDKREEIDFEIKYKINGELIHIEYPNIHRTFDSYELNNVDYPHLIAMGKSFDWGAFKISLTNVFEIDQLENSIEDIPEIGIMGGASLPYEMSKNEIQSVFTPGRKEFYNLPDYPGSTALEGGAYLHLQLGDSYYHSIITEDSYFEITEFGVLHRHRLKHKDFYPDLSEDQNVFFVKVSFSCIMQLAGAPSNTISITDGEATFLLIN